ncbi:hypothetical protein CLOACE_19310 [Clostridium acetireducens DSM 10703]|uniref:Uncharacterized protein n=1 Tax=Clostridium acetireducens DSM 10703 TaxID=1121290 RepID=A0A1E8EWN8_9CLOT|nr:hypothetical protein [Clostridium acetireducens]OFI05057.1 hypothetical protein CLOACE_19310 [Clostridium acetireducens DSM 10703]
MSYSESKTRKYTDFTIDDVKDYIHKFRKAILDSKYIISKNENRKENIDFIEDYKIDTKKEKEILLSIQYNDFCYAVDNEKKEFAYEKLYIFCKCQKLDFWGTLEDVDIYIKINMTKTRRGDDYIIIVSFHKRNKPIKYLFK